MRYCIILFLVFFTFANGMVFASEKLSLQLRWHHQFQFAGYYMAKEMGYYQDANLDVEILDYVAGTDSVEEVISGSAAFGINDSGLLVARSLGKPVVPIAVIMQQSPAVLLTLKSSNIRTPADFFGKRVMLAPGFQGLPQKALLQQEGLIDKVKILETSSDFTSLLKGETDAFNAYRGNEPYSLETLGHPTYVIDPEDYGIYFYGDTLFTAKDFLLKNPRTVEKFRKASLKGWDYALTHQDEAIAVIRSKYHSQKTVAQLHFEAESLAKSIQADQMAIGSMDLGQWAQITQHLIAIGAVPAKFHLSNDFMYAPPLSLNWERLRVWVIGVLSIFVALCFFLFLLLRMNFKLKSAQREIQQSEEKHRSLFENAPFPYQSLDENGCFTNVNNIWLQTLGYSNADVIGQWYGNFLEDESKNLFIENFPILKNSGYVHNIPFKLRHKNGHYIDIVLEGRSGYSSLGQFFQTYCIFRDITESEEAKAKLQLSETKFRLFADYTHDWEYWADPSGNLLYISPSCERISGYTATEFIEQPNLLVEITTPAFKEDLEKHISKGKDQESPVCQLTFSITTKAGELCWLEHHCLPVYDEQGVFVGRRGCNRDITQNKMIEEARLELEAQLRQKYKMEAVGVMAGGMAHNFNNTLSIILGNLDLINLQKNLTVDAQSCLKNAKIGVLRSRDLIQQIMAYSRSEEQKLISIQLEPVVHETLNLLRSMIPTSIYLQYNATPESLEAKVLADATRVQEALLNLCNNAVHAMDETGRLTIYLDTVTLQSAEISAEYSECSPGDFVRLRVQDTGSGMTDELLSLIFDPFYTTKGVGEGTGMGLSTVQGMIKQIGGQILVSSTLGEGTSFALYFPVTENELLSPLEEEKSLQSGTERILFVDDDEMLATLGELLLSGIGYQVSMMTDSTEALKLFTANADRFDVVITDQTMPGLTGKDLIAEIKKVRPDISTILCTGYSSKVDEEKAAELGISAFLMKPLDLPTLSQTIRWVLDEGNGS